MAKTPRPEPSWVALEGPSGVGKSTLLRALVRATDRAGLVEAYDRETPPPSLEFRTRAELLRIEQHLVDLELARFQEAQTLRGRGIRAFLDTGFAGPLTYSRGLALERGPAWDVSPAVQRRLALARRRRVWSIPDLTVYLDASPRVVARRRASDPRNHPAQWSARHAAVGVHERAMWLGALATALPGRVVSVDANGTLEETADRVLWATAHTAAAPHNLLEDSRRFLALFRVSPARAPR